MPPYRLIVVLILCFNFLAFARKPKVITPPAKPTPVVSVSPSPIPSISPSPVPTKGYVSFVPVKGYATTKEIAKIKAAEIKMNEVIQSQCFRDFMTKRKLIQTNDRTSAQVVDHLQSITDTVPLKMYYRCMGGLGCTSAVAFRQPPQKTINLNRAYFTSNKSDCRWAGTQAHEALGHSLGGYKHSFKWNRARSFSVPYSMSGADHAQGGDAFEACCK